MQLEQHVTALPTPSPPHDVRERMFPRAPEAVSEARRFVEKVYTDLDQDPTICALLVSEAATNAVLHASGDEFRVRITSPAMRVEVWDASHVVPIPMGDPRAEAEGGRGLDLIGQLASGVQWALNGEGKTLSFIPNPGT
ncbi:ATP-binding protein [Streptomyces sp. NPDC001809]